MKLIPFFVAVLGFGVVQSVSAQGCCGSAPAAVKSGGSCPHQTTAPGCGTEKQAGCEHSGQARGAVQAAAKASITAASLPHEVRNILGEYLKVQTALAADSFENASASAKSLAQAVRCDTEDVLPAAISQQVQALAEAKDLAAAREAFKPLSESLIQFARACRVAPGAYVEMYCPMAKAGWLQSEKDVKNPYHGSSMLSCGEIKG